MYVCIFVFILEIRIEELQVALENASKLNFYLIGNTNFSKIIKFNSK